MNKNKIIYGLLSVLVGVIAFMLIIDTSSKPTNIGISFNPTDSLGAYFFGFVWIMGSIGWVLGSLLLIGLLISFYFVGIWIYKKRHSSIKQ